MDNREIPIPEWGRNESVDHSEAYGESPKGPSKAVKAGLLIGGIVVLVLLIAFGIYFLLFKDKIAIKKGFDDLGKQLEEYRDPVIDRIDVSALVDAYYEGSSVIDYSLNVSGIEDVPTTIGIDGLLNRDAQGRELSSDLSISVMNNTLLNPSLYAKGNDVFISAPELFDSSLYFNARTLGQDMNDSIFGGIVSLEEYRDLSIDLFPEKPDMSGYEAYRSLMKDPMSGIGKLKKDLSVDTKKGKAEVETYAGVEECKIYTVTIPAESMEELSEDMVWDLYLNQKKRIRRMVTASPISFEYNEEAYSDIEMTIDLLGEEAPADMIFLQMNNAAGGTEFDEYHYLELLVRRTENESKRDYIITSVARMTDDPDEICPVVDVTLDTDVTNDTFSLEVISAYSTGENSQDMIDLSADVILEGTVRESIGDMLLDMTIDSMLVTISGEDICKITGNVSAFAKDPAIIPITGNSIDVFHMNLIDMLSLAKQLEERYGNLFGLFGGGGGGFADLF